MNARLIESLVQVIESLSPEERGLLESRLKANAIEKTPGICGGNARIRSTRIPVWTLVSFRQQGAGDSELLRNYPSLTPQNLAAAWEYYEQNSSEVDRAIVYNNSDGVDD